MTIIYFLGALLLFGVIVMVHELGHFLSARMLGIHALEFAIGMGPKLWSHAGKRTRYTIRAIPMGGYCAFEGEDDGNYDNPDSMNNQKPWKRFIIIASGPLMNFLFAFLVVVMLSVVLGGVSPRPFLAELEPDGAAIAAGMQVGDVITSIDGEQIPYSEDGMRLAQSLIQSAGGKSLQIGLRRGEEPLVMELLVPDPSDDEPARIGIWLGTQRVRVNVFEAAGLAGPVIANMMSQMIEGLKGLVFRGEGLEETSGPVGMLHVMTKSVESGWDQAITLAMFISLNLGIMNLLPLPALDGGRLVFIAIEWITRKRLKPELEGWVHATGFILLIGLMLVLTYNDILRLFTGS